MSVVPTRIPAPPRREGTVVVSADERWCRGRALDIRAWDVSPTLLVDAVRRAAAPGPTRRRRSHATISVDCAVSGPVHDHVCRVPPDSFDLHDALVAAARSVGHRPPSLPALERARTELVRVEAMLDTVDLSAAKRRVAEAGETERRLAERTATLRGRLAALREMSAETKGVEAELATAVERLTDVETERIAAEQRLSQVARTAREARDHRQRRLRLADRVANRRRQARAALVDAVYADFAAAVDALPGDARAGANPTDYTGDPSAAALAVASLARFDSPVVLVDSPFGSVAEAATRLDVPVVLV